MYYSKTTGGFYLKPAGKGSTPDDALEISNARYSELLSGQAEGKRIVPGSDGYPIVSAPPARSIDELAYAQSRGIQAALDDALAAGMPYTMPDGTEDVVQMLAEDRQNLLGLAIEARDLKAAGVTDPVQEFRGLSNTRYPMTPDQVIALTDAALSHYKALLQRSWDRKDAIDAALEVGDREGVEGSMW